MYRSHVNPSITGFHNSRIFGLYGEAMLNFGPLLAVLAFLPAGYIIGRMDLWSRSLQASDSRILLVPLISNCALMLILADSDNLVFFAFKNGLLPFLFVLLISRIFISKSNGQVRSSAQSSIVK